MSYKLNFLPSALKEWEKLDYSIKVLFKKKLSTILVNPCIPENRLRNMPDCYKIKLKDAGYRLVYEVNESEIIVLVISVGRRDKFLVYKNALKRFRI